MPRRWLLAFIAMLPRLEAEAALVAITATTLPHLDHKRGASVRRRIIGNLQRTAAGRARSDTPPGASVARTGAEVRRWLAQVGGIDAREHPGRDCPALADGEGSPSLPADAGPLDAP